MIQIVLVGAETFNNQEKGIKQHNGIQVLVENTLKESKISC